MREKFIKYAETITSGKSMLSILKELRKICAKNNLFHEEGACLEKIYHITHEAKLYEEIGDIFLYKVRNREIANAAYNKFIYNINSEFFNKYIDNLIALGFKYDNNIQDNDLPNEINDLCDRFDVIVYMILCLLKHNDYEGVLILYNKFLTIAKSKIIEYKDKHIGENNIYITMMENTERHLSEMLTQTNDNNEINILAINLLKTNIKAYMNILDNYITHKNYRQAIEFYLNNVCNRFHKCKKTDNIKEICWEISNFYKDNYKFYQAVKFQKIAIELELSEDNENA